MISINNTLYNNYLFINIFKEISIKNIIKRVSKRKAIYLRFTVELLTLSYPHLSLYIGKDKYFPSILGYPINKNYTKTRKRLDSM